MSSLWPAELKDDWEGIAARVGLQHDAAECLVKFLSLPLHMEDPATGLANGKETDHLAQESRASFLATLFLNDGFRG